MLSWFDIRRKVASAFTPPVSMESSRVLESAPGPSPWYLRTGHPEVPGFVWTDGGDSKEAAGATLLTGADGPVLILDFHNYVQLVDRQTLLVWHQRVVPSGPTHPVVLRIFAISKLSRLEGGVDELCVAMRQNGTPLIASGPPQWEVSLPTTVVGERRNWAVPAPLDDAEELLILCYSSAIDESPMAERSNLALLIARPPEGTYELYPQDWFNNGGLDYGYQGVTRVARDPESKRIHGEGFRIGPFVLDDTLRRTL